MQDTKDASALDWYVEGPGRRVGYENLTAIDWIFEYAKERQRLRVLYSSTAGIVGNLRQLADASQIWVVLIATGLASGAIAACIDIVSDWLGDLKTGFCSDVENGGKFYLSQGFCCWGHEELAKCHDWRTWSSAMGVHSRGGSYIIEYFIFVVFSVSMSHSSSDHPLMITRYFLRPAQVSLLDHLLFTRSIVGYPRSRRFWVGLSYGVLWAHGL